MKEKAKISVIIPTFNRVDYIGQTLLSILNQTLSAYEVIIVDDGSLDNTLEIIDNTFNNWVINQSDSSKIPKLKVIKQANQGPASARNNGIKNSSGEILHFFDSDDIAAPNKHYEQYKKLIDSNADIVVSPWIKSVIQKSKINKRYNFEEAVDEKVIQQFGLPKGNLAKHLLTDWALISHACLYKKEIVNKIGGFREDFFGTEDTLFLFDCILAGAKFSFTNKTCILYRTNNIKISAGKSSEKRHIYESARSVVKMHQLASENGMNPDKYFLSKFSAWNYKRMYYKHLLPKDETYFSLKKIIYPKSNIFWIIFQLLDSVYKKVLKIKTGSSYYPSFKCGSILSSQVQIFESIGYYYKKTKD